MTKLFNLPFSPRSSRFLNSRLGRLVTTIGSILFSLIVLSYLIYRQRDILLTYQWHIRSEFLLSAYLIYSPALIIAAIVWSQIIKSLGYHVDFVTHFRYYSISNLAKRLPATVWYVLYRNQMYNKQGLPSAVTSLASGMEFVVVLLSGIIIISIFALPILVDYEIGVVGVAILLILGVVFLNRKMVYWLLNKAGVDRSNFNYTNLITWVAEYALIRLLAGVLVFCIINAIYPVSYQSLSYIIGSWTLVGVLSSLLFFSPSNLGFNEVTFSLLLTRIMPSSIAVIAAIMIRICLITFELIWALVILGGYEFSKQLTNK